MQDVAMLTWVVASQGKRPLFGMLLLLSTEEVMELGGQPRRMMKTPRMLAGCWGRERRRYIFLHVLEVSEYQFAGWAEGDTARWAHPPVWSAKIEWKVFPGVFYQDCFASRWIFWIPFQHYFPTCFLPQSYMYYLINADWCHALSHLRAKRDECWDFNEWGRRGHRL